MPQVWPQHDKIKQSAPAFRVLWAESRSSNIMVRRQKPGAHRVTSIIDDSAGSSKKCGNNPQNGGKTKWYV